eukprot:GHVQ01021064.1.p1 GENE.GHVQ01021064.1~~GHVQ01021064.1.p1  ORF type:complete len:200 (+),score=16.94 GHVQ01021064.1:308-907(+)
MCVGVCVCVCYFVGDWVCVGDNVCCCCVSAMDECVVVCVFVCMWCVLWYVCNKALLLHTVYTIHAIDNEIDTLATHTHSRTYSTQYPQQGIRLCVCFFYRNISVILFTQNKYPRYIVCVCSGLPMLCRSWGLSVGLGVCVFVCCVFVSLYVCLCVSRLVTSVVVYACTDLWVCAGLGVCVCVIRQRSLCIYIPVFLYSC